MRPVQAFFVKYDRYTWAGYENGFERGAFDDSWPLPGYHHRKDGTLSPREPVVDDNPPRKGDLLVWQGSPPRRLMGHGVVTHSRLEWREAGAYGGPGIDGRLHGHEATYWFRDRIKLWLPRSLAPQVATPRDDEFLAYPYRYIDGLSGQAAIVPISVAMARRLIRQIEGAAR